jgi:cytoskeletal protein CcmA (bactofilin family)
MSYPGGPYWGKYRATVIDNADPMTSARLLCEVPSAPGGVLNWAAPCVPYAFLEQGLVTVPPVGANVWIEFEGGNLDFPVWTGCFWETGEVPVMPQLSPELPSAILVLRGKCCSLVMNDLPGEGGITLTALDPAVDMPVTVTLNSSGVTVEVGELSLLMNPEAGITLRAGETKAILSPETGVSITAPEVAISAEKVTVTGDITLDGPTNVTGTLDVAGVTSLKAEASVTGDLLIEGATTAEGDVNIAGALSTEGDANITGAVSVEGESNFAGAVSVEGDIALAGAMEVAGDVTAALFTGAIALWQRSPSPRSRCASTRAVGPRRRIPSSRSPSSA